MSGTGSVENNLAHFRRKRGFSAAHLAGLAETSRQTIYAIEAGSYAPNTALALKLARALEASVEELFSLPGDLRSPKIRSESAALLPGSETLQPGQPVQLCRVEKRMLASSPSPFPWYFPVSDGVAAAAQTAQGRTKIHVFDPEEEFRNRLLVAGCDPAISVLARTVRAAGIELVLAHRNSSQSLKLLREGFAHVAGTHLRDDATGESNLSAIDRLFPRRSVAVFSFAIW
ncbi:MAG TPA: substrate-binding domain-containing protein, partial [Bryobacteraceae bacterium]|nr:substrate-binding domain-containing protein [Bryobacteraceae bacterium]